MDALPPEVQRALAALRGAAAVLLYEPALAPARATLYFFTRPHSPPVLAVTVLDVRDAQWGFLEPPRVRVAWRFAQPVESVRLATVRAFSDAGPGATVQSVRVELDVAGARNPALALEGAAVNIGPLPRPRLTAATPPSPATVH